MIPKNLIYNNKLDSSSSRSWRSNLAPQNGTSLYKANDVITFNIPTSPNLVTVMSENYLKFDVKFTAVTNASAYLRWDSCGAHGLINRIRIYNGSNLLEDIEDYAALAKMFFDVQVQTSSSFGKYNILCGTRSDYVTSTPAFLAAGVQDAATTVTTLSNKTLSVKQVNSGDRILSPGIQYGNLAVGDSITKTYCLNLISLCGSLCSDKYFPLFACKSSPLKIEIFLQPSIVNAMCCDQVTTTFELSNVEYIANMIELSDNAIQTIYNSLQGNPLQFVIPTYRTFNFSGLAIGTTGTYSFSIPIAARVASLKGLYIMLRDSTKPAATFFPFDSHTFNLIDYTFRIGAKTIPAKSINTYPEMFSELVKAVGSMSNLNYSPSIEMYSYCGNYSKPETVAANIDTLAKAQGQFIVPVPNDEIATALGWTNSGSFYIGLDCESYSNADKSNIFTGINTNNDDIFFNPNFTGFGAAITNIRITTFANFDATIIFENDTCYLAI